MVVTWFDGVRVHRHVSAAQVLAPSLVCDGKQQRLDSQAVGSARTSQQSQPSILFFYPHSRTGVHGCRRLLYWHEVKQQRGEAQARRT